MQFGWQKVRGAGHVKVEATQPAWFDQEGTKRKIRARVTTKVEDGLTCTFICPEEQLPQAELPIVTIDKLLPQSNCKEQDMTVI